MDEKMQLDVARNIIEGIYKNSDITDPFFRKTDPPHSKACLDWVLKLKPDASVALQIAALGHDIDRAFLKRAINIADYPPEEYEKYKEHHSLNSAEILVEYLIPAGLDESIINRVHYLVANHEVGGEEDAEILKTADSLTFFSLTISDYFEYFGSDMTRKKIAFMYQRLSNEYKRMVQQIQFNSPEISRLFKEASINASSSTK